MTNENQSQDDKPRERPIVERWEYHTEDTPYPKCPHCGYEDVANETDYDQGQAYECAECGKPFQVDAIREVEVYTTSPLDGPKTVGK